MDLESVFRRFNNYFSYSRPIEYLKTGANNVAIKAKEKKEMFDVWFVVVDTISKVKVAFCLLWNAKTDEFPARWVTELGAMPRRTRTCNNNESAERLIVLSSCSHERTLVGLVVMCGSCGSWNEKRKCWLLMCIYEGRVEIP